LAGVVDGSLGFAVDVGEAWVAVSDAGFGAGQHKEAGVGSLP
jgi:hypothetical protein